MVLPLTPYRGVCSTCHNNAPDTGKILIVILLILCDWQDFDLIMQAEVEMMKVFVIFLLCCLTDIYAKKPKDLQVETLVRFVDIEASFYL